jgi:hypothetical protein
MRDFGPVVARIRRAEEHSVRLQREVDAYAALPPYSRTERLLVENGHVVDRVEMVLAPPIELSLTFSDGIHQLRAALDNLVGVLRPEGPTELSGFPLSTDPAKWAAQATTKLAGISAQDVEAIRRLQPFAGRTLAFVGDTLLALHDLARVDRHRAPLLQAGIVIPRYASGEIVEWRGDRRTWAETEYEPGRASAIHYEVEVQIAEAVKGAEGREAARYLVWLVRQVTWIVDAFNRGVILEMLRYVDD